MFKFRIINCLIFMVCIFMILAPMRLSYSYSIPSSAILGYIIYLLVEILSILSNKE